MVHYDAHDVIDGDGSTDEPIPVRWWCGFGLDDRGGYLYRLQPGSCAPINCSRGALTSAVKTVLKALVGPHEPSNEGWFKPLTVDLAPPARSSPRRSPRRLAGTTRARRARRNWFGGRSRRSRRNVSPPAWYVSLCATYLAGSGRDGLFVHIEPQNGGWGATSARDGASGLIAITDGDTYNYSIELVEAKFPLLVRRYDYNVAGRRRGWTARGGFGLVREYEMERRGAAPWRASDAPRPGLGGCEGGGEGSTNGIEVVRGAARTGLDPAAAFPA